MKGTIIWWGLLLVSFTTYSQTYSPIPVTGFTQDIFAESGTNAVATTTAFLDATNHVMYTSTFASTNGINGGVLDNGTIVSGTRTYQIAPYTGLNATYMSLNGAIANTTASSTLILQTPASYSRLSFLSFSTEGTSTLNAVIAFTDGTTYNAGNFVFQDWFGGANSVYANFGRIGRLAAPPYVVDGYPTNPRWYAADIPISCTNQARLVQSITISYVSQSGTSGRAVALALSGVSYTPLATTATISPATCGASNGSIALTTIGGTSPLSYVWNTTPPQFTSTATGLAAGNYTATISDANGCTTTYQGTVTSSSAITVTTSANPTAICTGETATLTATSGGSNLTYTWSLGGQTGQSIQVSPTDTTTYTVTIQDPNGCTATATITLPVKKRPVASFTSSPLRLCLRNRDTITFTGTAGSNATYNWNFGSAAVVSGTGAGPYILQFNTAGTQNITLTVTQNGCASTQATGTVATDAFSQPAFSATPTTICGGDTIQVAFTGSAATGATPTWSWGGGTVVSGSGLGPYAVAYTASGAIRLIISNNTCSDTATIQNITVKPRPVASFTPSPLRLCLRNRDTVTFTGTAGSTATYNWNFGGSAIVSGTGAGPYVLQFNTVGTQNITLTVTENGCASSQATGTVITDAFSQPNFTATPAAICSGDTVQVAFTGTAATGATPAWNWGGGTVISGNGLGPYAVKYATSGTIQLVINNNTCSDTATVRNISVTPLPVASFTPSALQGCTPSVISFTNASQNGLTYSWDFGDNSTSTDQAPPSHLYDVSGSYSVVLRAINGNCSATSTPQTIRIVDPPTAGFTSTPDITATPLQISQAQFSFTNTSTGATTYKWLFGDLESSNAANPLHRYTQAGSFTVTLIASNALGCSDTFSKAPYIIIPDSSLRIPNAFSPNGDGINDRWVIPGLLGYPTAKIDIFDRYGQLVFTGYGYSTPWDGCRNGKDVPIGTYYYVIRTSLRNYNGWVFIAR